MCLAIPGKVIHWLDREPPLATASVEFGGISRVVNLACVPDAEIGDYVLVHAGIAITRIDDAEAERVLSTLSEAILADELKSE